MTLLFTQYMKHASTIPIIQSILHNMLCVTDLSWCNMSAKKIFKDDIRAERQR